MNENLNQNSKLNLNPKALEAKLGLYVADQPHSDRCWGSVTNNYSQRLAREKWQTPQGISSASLNKAKLGLYGRDQPHSGLSEPKPC